MSQPEAKRRWYQFTLRTLLIVVMAVAGLAGAWHIAIEPYRLQREAIAAITEIGGSYKTENAATWIRYLDKDAQDVVVVDLADCDAPSDYLPQLLRLPKLRTLVVSGHSVGDEELERLGRVGSLKGLVLDSTLVTDQAVDGLKEKRPDLVVYKSQRRAVSLLEKAGATLSFFTPQRDAPPLPPWLRADVADLYFADTPTVVKLDDTRVTDTDVSWLSALPDLRGVSLAKTRITGRCLQHVATRCNLESLGLASTQIDDHDLTAIRHFTRLRFLDLDGTLISDKGMTDLAALNCLVVLRLSNTHISDAGAKCISRLPSLRYLEVDNTQVGDAGLLHITDLLELASLNVANTSVTDRSLVHLQRAKSLMQVDLHGTGISDKGAVHLAALQTLRDICLRGTRMTDESVPRLANCKQLVSLDIRLTNISESGMKRLRDDLPECHILY